MFHTKGCFLLFSISKKISGEDDYYETHKSSFFCIWQEAFYYAPYHTSGCGGFYLNLSFVTF